MRPLVWQRLDLPAGSHELIYVKDRRYDDIVMSSLYAASVGVSNARWRRGACERFVTAGSTFVMEPRGERCIPLPKCSSGTFHAAGGAESMGESVSARCREMEGVQWLDIYYIAGVWVTIQPRRPAPPSRTLRSTAWRRTGSSSATRRSTAKMCASRCCQRIPPARRAARSSSGARCGRALTAGAAGRKARRGEFIIVSLGCLVSSIRSQFATVSYIFRPCLPYAAAR